MSTDEKLVGVLRAMFGPEDILLSTKSRFSVNIRRTDVQESPDSVALAADSSRFQRPGGTVASMSARHSLRRVLAALGWGVYRDIEAGVVELSRSDRDERLPGRQAETLCTLIDILPDYILLRHVTAEELAELRAMAREVIDFWAAAETGPRGLRKAPGAPKKGRDNVH